jgi:predicted RNase H-like HicB family nuclease
MHYTVVLLPEPEIDGYVAYVPAVGVATQGYSIQHALEMAAEATSLRLEVMAEDGEELPTEHPGAVVGSIEVDLRDPAPIRSVAD